MKYTSPDIQNKIIEITVKWYVKTSLRACNISEYVALIGGEALMYQHMNKSPCV